MGVTRERARCRREQNRVWNTLGLLLAISLWMVAAGATETRRDPETGLESWQVETRCIPVRLTQITPDPVRAFYRARDFTPEQVDAHASSCVFMTVVRNIGTVPIEHRLANRRYDTDNGIERTIGARRNGTRHGSAAGVSDPERIAFAWARFPTTQTFNAGDWNQGMTTDRLPPASRFNLIVGWRTSHARHKTALENVRCIDETQ